MRVSAKNPWGVKDSSLDQQRTDLWMVDMDVPSKEMGISVDMTRLYVTQVKIPDLDVTGDLFKRDSRPYYLPGYDKPREQVSMTFLYPIPAGEQYPPIYRMLYRWQELVRAGRGSMSKEPSTFISAANRYRVRYSWDIPVRLLRGSVSDVPDLFTSSAQEGLETSSAHILKNAWICSLGLSELDMNTSRGLEIRAAFYCEDVLLSTPNGTQFS